MKKIIFALSLFMINSVFATSPFNISGNKINAVFQSDMVWKNVFDPVVSIEFVKHNKASKTSSYLFKTKKCKFLAEVKDVSMDELVPKWEVTKAETSGCL